MSRVANNVGLSEFAAARSALLASAVPARVSSRVVEAGSMSESSPSVLSSEGSAEGFSSPVALAGSSAVATFGPFRSETWLVNGSNAFNKFK